ncbi:MAG: hypothetical protein ABI744_03780 [Chloroflexota bacterium]
MPETDWRFEYRASAAVPPLFWVARIAPPLIEVTCGTSVRRAADAFVCGTWAGGAELRDLAQASTVFGSGIVITADGPLVVTPSHAQESLFATQGDDATFVSNSIAGLLQHTGQRLDPNFAYPEVFFLAGPLKHLDQAGQPPLVSGRVLVIPTLDGSIHGLYCENFRVQPDGGLVVSRKPRERTFIDFTDYRTRLLDATRSLMANAPGHAPVVTLSSGYDSTAVACVVAAVGGRRAVGFRTARRHGDNAIVDDSGAATAARLGLSLTFHDRLAYLARDDLPEAEFLSSGMSGEDVVASAFEDELRGTLLFTGHWGGRMWSESWRPSVQRLPPPELSGNSMADLCLRLDAIHVPLPYFGALQEPTTSALLDDPTMAPYRVGGYYDRPIARRLAEEAGLSRGSFAGTKVAVSQLLHKGDRATFALATVAAIERFAAAEGRRAEFRSGYAVRSRHRAAIKIAHKIAMGTFVRGLEQRRQRAVHFDAALGGLVFRWAVSVVGPRYAAGVDSEPPGSLT